MINILINKINRRLNFTSKYNVKLYKKSLSLKLIIDSSKGLYKQPNIIYIKNNPIYFFYFKCIYARKERVPLRLLRFFFLINSSFSLVDFNVNFLIAKKLTVYNGRQRKFINTNSDF